MVMLLYNPIIHKKYAGIITLIDCCTTPALWAPEIQIPLTKNKPHKILLDIALKNNKSARFIECDVNERG